MEPKCSICDTPVRPRDKEVWTRVQGWERPGRAGGSDIVLREAVSPTVFACPTCIAGIRAGVHVDQLTIA